MMENQELSAVTGDIGEGEALSSVTGDVVEGEALSAVTSDIIEGEVLSAVTGDVIKGEAFFRHCLINLLRSQVMFMCLLQGLMILPCYI